MEKIVFRAPFAYDVDQASDESGLKCKDKSLAKQEFADEVNINTIVKRFGLTGQLPEVVGVPQYGDFTGITDFQSAQEAVAIARMQFMELPAELRDRFQNDPQRLLEFVSSADNKEEAIKLGLVAAPVVEPPKAPEATPAVVAKPSS